MGTIVCVLLATVFVASRWMYFDTGVKIGTHVLRLCFGIGMFGIADSDSERWPAGNESIQSACTSRITPVSQPLIVWWPQPFLWIADAPGFRWRLLVPLWLPLVIILLPTLWLWRLDRRRPRPGHCRKCDYNLTGNTSGRCPECGTATGA